MKEEFRIGQSLIRIDGDLLQVVDCRDFGRAETQELCARLSAIRAKHGRVYLIFESSHSPTVSPEGRRVWSDFTRHTQLDAAACYNVGLASRALLALIHRASELRGGKKYTLSFASTESEALHYIDEHRRRAAAV